MKNTPAEALHRAKSAVQQASLMIAAMSKTTLQLRTDEDALKEYERTRTINANTALLENATRVLRKVLEDVETRRYLESIIFGQNAGIKLAERTHYIVLADKNPLEEGISSFSLLVDIPDGHQQSSTSYHIALAVVVNDKTIHWSVAAISYCERACISALYTESWLSSPMPDFDEPWMLKALLHLQTPETALNFLVQKFAKPEM